jgi:hypothetical protein
MQSGNFGLDRDDPSLQFIQELTGELYNRYEASSNPLINININSFINTGFKWGSRYLSLHFAVFSLSKLVLALFETTWAPTSIFGMLFVPVVLTVTDLTPLYPIVETTFSHPVSPCLNAADLRGFLCTR